MTVLLALGFFASGSSIIAGAFLPSLALRLSLFRSLALSELMSATRSVAADLLLGTDDGAAAKRGAEL